MEPARIIADSVNPLGHRLTTFVLTYPRFIHAELLTHRTFSRNAASSRAIPTTRMIKMIIDNPAMPISWGKNRPGMQATEELDEVDFCRRIWLEAMRDAIRAVEMLTATGLHKQAANRLLEPFAHMTTLLSGTDFDNFFALRLHADAQPEMRALAEAMKAAYDASVPAKKAYGDWHIPFFGQDAAALSLPEQIKVATARAARVSYLNYEGVIDHKKDFELHDRLLASGHFSPFEHCAVAGPPGLYKKSNFAEGWRQYRDLVVAQGTHS